MEKKIAIIIDTNGQATVGELDNVTGAFNRLGDGAEQAGQRASRGSAEVDKATKKWQESGKAIGEVVGAIVGGVTALVGYQVKVAAETGKMAERLGVSTEFISAMGFAAKETAGVGMSELETMLGKMGDQAARAEQGLRRPAAAFKSLGIDVTDARGKVKSLEQLLPEVADKFEQMADGPREAAIATELFGEQGKKLLPLLNQGADGMAQWRQRAAELGLVLSKETTQGAIELTDNVGLLHVAVAGMANGWIKDAMPAMLAVSGQLAKDTQAAAKAGQTYTALGLIIKTLATGYYFLESIVKDVVNIVSAGVSTIWNTLTLVGSGLATVFKGAVGAISALVRGDLSGAYSQFAVLSVDLAKTAGDKVNNVRNAWSSAVAGIGISQDEFSQKVSDVWMPAAAAVDSSSKKATAGVDGLGDGFLGLGAKADASAKKAQAAADRLDTLLDKLRPKAAVSEVDQENAAYAVAQKNIDALEREMGAMAQLAEQQAKLTEARRLAADIHERQLRVAQAADAERARELDILGQVQDYYREQIRLAGLSAEAYRVEEQVIKRRNDALERGKEWTPEYEAQIRAAAELGEAQLDVAQAARRASDDFRDSWLNAVDSVWRAMGDFITRSIHSWSDFGKELLGIGQRWVSDLISQWGRNGGLDRAFQRMLNGGYADAGTSGGGSVIDAITGASGSGAGGGSFLGSLVNSVVGGVGRFFGFGNGQSASGWSNAYGASGTLAAGAGVLAPQYGGGTLMGAAGGAGGMNMAAMLASFANSGTGKFLQSSYAPWLAGVGGALYGWQKGGDTPGKALGAAAYGTAAYGVATGVGAGLSASAAGAGVGAAGAAGLAAIPVVGWIALAAIAVNAISGGKLFGTKYKLDSASNNFSYGDAGFDGTQSVTKVKQQSLFRGRKWTTSTSALSEEAQAALDQAFQAIDNAVSQAATQLGIAAPTLIGASFKQEFDKKGNLKSEFGTIAGRVYKEAQDAFNQRYLAENLLNVAGLASNHASTIQQLANAYRGSPEALTDFATLMLAIAGDAKAGKLLWDDTDAALQRAVGTLEDLQQAGESLAQTYKRISEGTRAYGDLIAGVRGELLTHDLSDYAQAQLQIEQQYRAQVKQANDLAKALGLSGARAEDLASIELLRAQRMGDLQRQMEKQRDEFLGTLRLSDLAPGTDQDKLTDAMQQLRTAVAGGDLQRAQQLAQGALGFGRNLYASGSDYNALYGTVTGLLEDLDPAAAGLTADALQQLADTMETLPTDIASALFALLAQPAPVPPPATAAPLVAPAATSGAAPPPAAGDSNAAALQAIAANTAATAAGTEELLRQQRSASIKRANETMPA